VKEWLDAQVKIFYSDKMRIHVWAIGPNILQSKMNRKI
jgi:hypothetical protein